MNQKKESTDAAKNLNQVIKIDEARIHFHLDQMVRDTVEDTLNQMLDAEADRLCNAQRYEHTDSRTDTRAGSYRRRLQTKAGLVNLKVPRLRKATLETVIIGFLLPYSAIEPRCTPSPNSGLRLVDNLLITKSRLFGSFLLRANQQSKMGIAYCYRLSPADLESQLWPITYLGQTS